MKKSLRIIYQLILWLIIWGSQWAIQKFSTSFIEDNIVLLILQIVIILLVIYWLAPKFIFQKKYLVFAILSFVIVSSCAYISYATGNNTSYLPHPPPHTPLKHGPHFRPGSNEISNLEMARRLLLPPSKLFVNYLLLSIAHFIATLFEAYSFIRKKEEEEIIRKSENLETELKLLKSQINPHFLFNALNNIYSLTNIDISKTQKSIINLSDMLRYVLYECDQKLVSLSKEIAYIKNYVKLFSLKSSKNLPINLNFGNGNPNLKIAPMLLIPFVENAFKHSNIERDKDTFINIEITDTSENEICFSIKNSKPKNELFKDEVGGIGLINVKKRLSILYPDKHKLTIKESENEYLVELLIELA